MPWYSSRISAFVVDRLVGRVGPQLAPNASVEPLGGRLGQPVGERGEEDGRVVVVLRREDRLRLFDAFARGDGEGTDVVTDARFHAHGKVRHGNVRPTIRLGHLLPKRVQPIELD